MSFLAAFATASLLAAGFASSRIWWDVSVPIPISDLPAIRTDSAFEPGQYTLTCLDLHGQVTLDWKWSANASISVALVSQNDIPVVWRFAGASDAHYTTSFFVSQDGPFCATVIIPQGPPAACILDLQFKFVRYASLATIARHFVFFWGLFTLFFFGVFWVKSFK